MLAAALGLGVQAPLAWLAARQGINVLLAVLVFATAVTIDPGALRRLAGSWRPLAGALAAAVTVLPALSWAASRVVAAGPLRDGVMAVGVAPCEIASVATTAMASGEAALAAGILIGTTVTAVAIACPVLTLEAGHASVHPGTIIASLALVVALPLAAGLALRAARPVGAGAERAAAGAATATVAALVALIAAEVHLSASYLGVAAGLVLFLASSAVTGRILGLGASRPAGRRRRPAHHLNAGLRHRRRPGRRCVRPGRRRPAGPVWDHGARLGTAVAGALRHRAARPSPASAAR